MKVGPLNKHTLPSSAPQRHKIGEGPKRIERIDAEGASPNAFDTYVPHATSGLLEDFLGSERLPAFPLSLSQNAGGYYCEHLLYVLREYAEQPDSGVLRSHKGHPFQTFLHIPLDNFAHLPDLSTQLKAFDQLQKTIEDVLEQYTSQIDMSTFCEEEIRVLLTGYGSFGQVTENPAESFVCQEWRAEEIAGQCYRGIPIRVETITLPVDDSALDIESGPLRAPLVEKPHIIISLGSYPGQGEVLIETLATSRNYDCETGRRSIREAEHAFEVNESLVGSPSNR